MRDALIQGFYDFSKELFKRRSFRSLIFLSKNNDTNGRRRRSPDLVLSKNEPKVEIPLYKGPRTKFNGKVFGPKRGRLRR